MRVENHARMSYTLTLQCGCVVYVACNPATGIAHTRVIEARGTCCTIRTHDVGTRLYLWELLPERFDGRPLSEEKRKAG